MSLKLNSSGGGSVTIADPASTASNFTLNPPLQNGTLVATDASGNVGIGTSSPSDTQSFGKAVDLRGTTGSAYYSGTTDATTRAYFATYTGGAYLGTETNHPQVFRTNNTERMRIDTSGNLLVGTTSNLINPDFKLQVLNSLVAAIFKSTPSSASVETVTIWNNQTSGDNRFIVFDTETVSSQRGSIDYNRGAGLVRYNTTSDANLKNIIGDADGTKSIDVLKSTKIREYSWKDDETNKPQIGVIAQELYETFKGAVSVGGEKVTTDADGNETTQYVPWAVDKTAFTFHLIAGWQAHERVIQEQQALITQLTERVHALEAK